MIDLSNLLPQPSTTIKAVQERVKGDLDRHRQELNRKSGEAGAASDEYNKWHKEAAKWAFLAKIHGGDSIDTYKQIKQKEQEAYQKMQIADNEYEKVKNPLPPVPEGLRGRG